MLDAANYVDFNILIKVCIKTIIQKFDFNSLKNTLENLQLDQTGISTHESWNQNEGLSLKAVFDQLESQYQILPDMINQIYKSIPLSVHVRLKTPAKIIGALFIAFTKDVAYTLNIEIEISLGDKEAESKGNEILNAFNAKTSISHLLPPFGYRLDDKGHKSRINEEYMKILTHPYIFELVWYLSLISLTESNGPSLSQYSFIFFSLFNRKDILQVIYESSKTPEGIICKNDIFDILKGSLRKSIEFGNYQIIEYLTRIGTELDIDEIFQLNHATLKKIYLKYLYHNKVAIRINVFDNEAIKGHFENIQWLVEHGYQGYSAIDSLVQLERRKSIPDYKQRVLDYLRANWKWKADDSTEFSRGNYEGDPKTN